jgi:hypothetical protein
MSDPNRKADARTCRFCGGLPITAEDVFPQWISDWAAKYGNTGWTLEGVEGNEKVFPPRPTSKDLNLIARQFCKSCNTGWMSDIEGRTRPILWPIMRPDGPRHLTAADQETLATWAFKTMLTSVFVIPAAKRRVGFSRETYANFFRDRKPPIDGVAVWLAGFAGTDPNLVGVTLGTRTVEARLTHGVLVSVPRKSKAILCTLRLNRAILQTFFWEGAGYPVAAPFQRGTVQRIWPITGASITCPHNRVGLSAKGRDSFTKIGGPLRDGLTSRPED